MDDIELRNKLTHERLTKFIKDNELPKYLQWFWFYPAKAAVEAAKAQLEAMEQAAWDKSWADMLDKWNTFGNNDT